MTQTTFGVTKNGFALPTLADILAQINAAVAGLPALQGINLGPDSPLGQLTPQEAARELALWQQAQGVYAALDPNQAYGLAVDVLLALTGCAPRRKATPTTTAVNLTGTPSATIAAGAITAAVSGTENYFTNSGGFTFDGSGHAAAVPFACTANGPTPCPANGLTDLANGPVTGVSSITGNAAGSLGYYDESDASCLQRRLLSLQSAGSGTAGAVQAALAALAGVDDAVCFENDDDVKDQVTQQPPHSIHAIVHPVSIPSQYVGGVLMTGTQAIAATIWGAKASGIKTWSYWYNEVSTSNPYAIYQSVTDKSGGQKNIQADYAKDAQTYLHVQIAANLIGVNAFNIGVKQQTTVTVGGSPVIGDVVTIAVNNGVDNVRVYSHTVADVGGGVPETTTAIATALIYAINHSTAWLPASAANATLTPTNAVVITALYPGNPLNVVCTTSTGAGTTLTAAVTRNNSGDALALVAAIQAYAMATNLDLTPATDASGNALAPHVKTMQDVVLSQYYGAVTGANFGVAVRVIYGNSAPMGAPTTWAVNTYTTNAEIAISTPLRPVIDQNSVTVEIVS